MPGFYYIMFNAKDRTEDVLKSIHMLLSKAEFVEGSRKRIVIDKNRMMTLLGDLNDCIYALMDEYELTAESKERALMEFNKKSDELVYDAKKSAEDIYAASIMYTEHALNEVSDIIDRTREGMERFHAQMNEELDANKQTLRDNQIDLKNKLNGLIDSQKYLRLVERENDRLRREAEKQAEAAEYMEDEKPKVTAEIRINEDYFRATGLLPSLDEVNASEKDSSGDSDGAGSGENITSNAQDKLLTAEPFASEKEDTGIVLTGDSFDDDLFEDFEGFEDEDEDIDSKYNKDKKEKDTAPKKGLFGFGRSRQ